jgi:hypothetical protein
MKNFSQVCQHGKFLKGRQTLLIKITLMAMKFSLKISILRKEVFAWASIQTPLECSFTSCVVPEKWSLELSVCHANPDTFLQPDNLTLAKLAHLDISQPLLDPPHAKHASLVMSGTNP